MGRYRVKEFATLAGVTIKALHHYDRLGLLKPRRTSAGYRMYGESDLERLEQIIALRFLGVPLKRIGAVLDRADLALPEALRAQRLALEEKQVLLARAVRAIRTAEQLLESGQPATPAILRTIIEAIEMQSDIDAMKQYYSTEEAWARRRRYYEEGPSREWRALYRDISEAFEEDPASEKAQALADRWLELSVRAYRGDPEVQTDSMTAWVHRQHWPESMKRRIAEFNLERANEFVNRAAMASRKKYFSPAAWERYEQMRNGAVQDAAAAAHFRAVWQARVDLFRDIEACLAEDPAGEKGRALALRWMAHVEAVAGGDAEVQAGLINTWADRRNWRATLRWREESFSMTSSERFEQAANFIDEAMAALAGPA